MEPAEAIPREAINVIRLACALLAGTVLTAEDLEVKLNVWNAAALVEQTPLYKRLVAMGQCPQLELGNVGAARTAVSVRIRDVCTSAVSSLVQDVSVDLRSGRIASDVSPEDVALDDATVSGILTSARDSELSDFHAICLARLTPDAFRLRNANVPFDARPQSDWNRAQLSVDLIPAAEFLPLYPIVKLAIDRRTARAYDRATGREVVSEPQARVQQLIRDYAAGDLFSDHELGIELRQLKEIANSRRADCMLLHADSDLEDPLHQVFRLTDVCSKQTAARNVATFFVHRRTGAVWRIGEEPGARRRKVADLAAQERRSAHFRELAAACQVN